MHQGEMTVKRKMSLVALAAALSTGSAFAADLPSIKAPLVIPPPPLLWTGFYAGMNAGYSMSGSDRFYNGAAPLNDTMIADTIFGGNYALAAAASAWTAGYAPISGFIGGGQIGYNYQWSQFVLGLEADIQGSGVSGEGSAGGVARGCSAFPGCDAAMTASDMRRSVDWLGTVRGRAGWLFRPDLLIFASGGLAYGGVSAKTNQFQSWVGATPAVGASGLPSSVAVGELHTVNTGWTVGAGVEWMISQGWSLKAEYLYYNLGSNQYNSSWVNSGISTIGPTLYAAWHQTPDYDGHLVRLGLNYHFNWWGPTAAVGPVVAADLPSHKAPLLPPPPPPPLWTGPYAGLNAGYALSGSDPFYSRAAPLNDTILPDVFSGGNFALAAAASAGTTGSAPISGFLGGGQIGYNYQWNQFVLGLEADLQGSGIKGEGSAIGVAPATSAIVATNISMTESDLVRSVDWLGTVRGRAGWLFRPDLLVFASGGLAYGGVSAKTNQLQSWVGPTAMVFPGGLPSSVAVGELHTVDTGWTVGAGCEWMISPNWSLKAEYLYYNLGSLRIDPFWINAGFHTPTGPTIYAAWHQTGDYDGHIVRAGVNYHFHWFDPPAVVLAKY